MRRKSFLRYLFIPALVGLVATWAVYSAFGRRTAAAAPATQQVVVAARPVPAKSVLAAADLRLAPVPVSLTSGAATSIKAVTGEVTIAPLGAGQIVYEGSLAQPGNSGALSYHVPAGMRAESLRVNDVTGVSGMIQPGDRVDVIELLGKQVGVQQEARLLLQSVLVLAVGSNQQANPQGNGKTAAYQDVTLALSPQDAVVLAFANAHASLQLLLRPAVDKGTVGPDTVTNATLPH